MQNQQQQAHQQMQEAQQINQQDQQQINQEAQQINRQGQQQINRQGQQQINQEAQQQIQQEAQAYLPPAHADAAAAGEAVQQMAPARKTYKARRAEKRHAEEARKHCPVGDSATYDIKHQLEDYHKQKNNSMNRYFPEIETEDHKKDIDTSKNLSGVDIRVLRNFSHGYKTNWAGKPASADDRRYQREDQEFLDAFCSTDYVRRAPYLQRMVEEFLSFNLKEDMFSDQNIQKNAARYKSMGDHIVYLENVMEDKNNAFFFDSPLCPVKKEVLGKALEAAFVAVPAFMTACQKRGVEPDMMGAPYIAEDFRIEAYSLLAEDAAARFKGIPEQFKSLKESIRQEEEKSTPEMYQQMYSLIKGDVQKLLDCDVKKLNALSEEELRKLYSVSLGVDKCLTLKHPVYNERTLKDELVGQRRLEYEYKSAVLRGLVEKADGFKKQGKKTIEAAATRYQKQMTPGTDEFLQFFDSLRCMDLNHRVSFIPPKFAAVTRKFNAVPEEEHQRKIAEARRIDVAAKRMQRKGKSDKAGKITETMEPLLREGKIAEAMERLQSDWYHSLAYSQEQLKDMNMPSNIGEPLFRSFDGFLTYEAAQTLLTPEQFEQMLFNLGAGAGLDLDISEYEEQLKQAIEQAIEEENDKKRQELEKKKQELEKKKNDAEELRDEAIKMNNAGLDTLREVLTAQYDMLERKYGSSLEQLTIKELMEHYVDIGRDFTNGQQDLNMADNYPGFIREGNLEDERLYNQIQYYRRCSYAIDGLINLMGSGYIPEDSFGANQLEISDESIKKYMHNLVTMDEETTAAREYLMQNKDSFQHPLDWSQKVKNPADGN